MGLLKNPFSKKIVEGNQYGEFEPTEAERKVIESCSELATPYQEVQQIIDGLELPHDRQEVLEGIINSKRMSNVMKNGPERGATG